MSKETVMTESTEPTESTEHAEQADSTEPTQPTEHAEQAEPAESQTALHGTSGDARDGDARDGSSRPTSRARRIGGGGRSSARPEASAPGGKAAAKPAAKSAVKPAAKPATGPAAAKGGARDRVAPAVKPARRQPPAAERATTAGREPAGVARWVPAAGAAVGAAAAVVFLVLGVIAAHGVWWGTAGGAGDERGAVLAAAKSCMATMNTYDYRKLDQAEKAGLACTTGELTAEYRTAMEKVIKPKAATIQFTQSAQVLNAGIESVSADGSQWTVLVFGQLTTTNSATATGSATPGTAPTGTAPTGTAPTGAATPGTPAGSGAAGATPGVGSDAPRLNLFSARAVMEKVGGQWRVANYEYAPSS